MIPFGKICVLAVLIAVLSSCTGRPAAPAVHLITDAPGDLEGARAWEPLGFDVALEESGLPECGLGWYVYGETDCEITIGVVRTPVPTRARSYRDQRRVELDPSLNERATRFAMAHEVGHILLDTPKHTVGGIMGGSTYWLTAVDRALACETIHICTED